MLFAISSNDQKMSKIIFERRLKYQQKAINAIVFVNIKVKIYYDVKH